MIVEVLREAIAANQPFVPVHAVFGVLPVAVGHGTTTFRQDMGSHVLDRHGRISPGALFVAIDGALGSAIGTVLPEGRSLTTLHMRAQFLCLEPAGIGALTVRADVRHVGTDTAIADGEVLDDQGRLLARTSTRCGLLPQPSPLRIDRTAAVLPAKPWVDEGPGVLAAVAEHHLGARVAAVEPGHVVLTATPGPAVRNARGHVQGGVLGMLAEQAVTLAVLKASPDLVTSDAADLDFTYVRPATGDGRPLTVEARVEHAGRRFTVARAEVRDCEGRLVLLAAGSRYGS